MGCFRHCFPAEPRDLLISAFPMSGTLEALGDMLLKSDPTIVAKPTSQLKKAMKSMALIAVATGVVRAKLVTMKQDRDEAFRAFAARVRGKAETCSYHINCACGLQVDFTEVMIRDVLIGGIYDMDIRRDIIGTQSILQECLAKFQWRNLWIPPSNEKYTR